MSCRPGFSILPGQYKSATGLQTAGCPIRLKQLNEAKKPAPTKLRGSQVARGNLIRRRVAAIRQVKDCLPENKRFKGEQCNETYAYGPVFGLRKAPRVGGDCRKIYSANGGSSSDVIQWKRLYGGSRQLFSTSACKYGCCGEVSATELGEGCKEFTVTGHTSVALKKGDALWPLPTSQFSQPIDLFDARIKSYSLKSSGVFNFDVLTKTSNSVMGNILSNTTEQTMNIGVFRLSKLNKWNYVGFISKFTAKNMA